MKAETVQRQHLQELRSTKDRPSIKSTPENNLSRKRTARKSTNPHKQTSSATSSPIKENDLRMDEQTSTSSSAPPEPSQPDPTVQIEPANENRSKNTDPGTKEDVLSSETSVAEPGGSGVDTSSPTSAATSKPDPNRKEELAANPEDIDKVWETIRNDLTSVADDHDDDDEDDCEDSREEGELEEMMLEHHSIPHSPIVEEEEEPSDWEDREQSLEDEAVEESESRVKKVVSECVLISSDDEGPSERRNKTSGKSTKNDGLEEDEEEEDEDRLQLDTSSEVSETPSHKRVSQDFEALNTNDNGLELSNGMKNGNEQDADLGNEEKDTADEKFLPGESTLDVDLNDVSTVAEPSMEGDVVNNEDELLQEDEVPEDVEENNDEGGEVNEETIEGEAEEVDTFVEEVTEEVEEAREEVIEGEDEVPEDAGNEYEENGEEVPEVEDEDVAEAGEEDQVQEGGEDEKEVGEEVVESGEIVDEVEVTGEEADEIVDEGDEEVEETGELVDEVEEGEEEQMEVCDKDMDQEMDENEEGEKLTLEDDETLPESELQENADTDTRQTDAGSENQESSTDATKVDSVAEQNETSIPSDSNVEDTHKSDAGDSKTSDADQLKSNEEADDKVRNIPTKEQPMDTTNDSKMLDLDLEVLDDDATENGKKGNSAKQQPVDDKTCAKDVQDKDIEMIDLEILDAEQKPDKPTDTKVADSSEVVTATANDAEQDDTSQPGKEDESTARSASCSSPELVELDLDNDSDANLEDSEAASKVNQTLNASGDSVQIEDSVKCHEDEKKDVKLVEKTDPEPVEVDLSLDQPDVDDKKNVNPLEVDSTDLKENEVKDDITNSDVKSEVKEEDKDSLKSSRKRHLSQNNNLNCSDQSKKLRLDLSEEPLEDALNQLESLRKKEKKTGTDSAPRKLRLTKEMLEEFVTRRIADHINISQKSIIGELRGRCDALEKMADKWRKRAQTLQSSINELNAELAKHQKKPRGPTRTVGINVRISTSEPLRPLNVPKPSPPVIPKPMESVVRTAAPMAVTTMGGPVPMHLIPNLASNSPNKTYLTTSAQISSGAVQAQKQILQTSPATQNQTATIKFIDLTTEDEEAALKNVRQQPQQIQQIPVSLTTCMPPGSHPSFTTGGTVLTNALSRPTAPVTLTSNGTPLLNMPVPVTMQLIPTMPQAGPGFRGPRPPTMNLPAGIGPPGARVTTYLVPTTAPSGMGSPRQIVPIGQPSVVPQVARQPGSVQTFVLRMNAPANSNTFTPVGANMGPGFVRGPPNVTLTSRNILNTGQPVVQTSVLNTMPKNVTTTIKPINQPVNPANTVVIPLSPKHPAPFPPQQPYPHNPQLKTVPPKPALKISKVANGIVLSWNLTINSTHAEIAKYQLFAYQEGNGPPLPSLWKKVGDVKALPLPMACTLTQFVEGNKYHFAVCAVDKNNRTGPFSDPSSILLAGK